MSDDAKLVEMRAEKAARKAQQDQDAHSAMREYQEELKTTLEKTARLRALRLAKEAADRAAAQPKTKKMKATG